MKLNSHRPYKTLTKLLDEFNWMQYAFAISHIPTSIATINQSSSSELPAKNVLISGISIQTIILFSLFTHRRGITIPNRKKNCFASSLRLCKLSARKSNTNQMMNQKLFHTPSESASLLRGTPTLGTEPMHLCRLFQRVSTTPADRNNGSRNRPMAQKEPSNSETNRIRPPDHDT